jgi:hypothetical protein
MSRRFRTVLLARADLPPGWRHSPGRGTLRIGRLLAGREAADPRQFQLAGRGARQGAEQHDGAGPGIAGQCRIPALTRDGLRQARPQVAWPVLVS